MVTKFFSSWSTERLPTDQRIQLPDSFLQLEEEIAIREEGITKLYQAGNIWIDSLGKKVDGEEKEKCFPIEKMGQVMVSHGKALPNDSPYGTALVSYGQVQLKIGELLGFFTNRANVCYLDFLKRYLVQMKDYHTARKKLESRRQTYESLLVKSYKAKKEDSRLEEDIRLASYKFEESTENVRSRMVSLKEAEIDQQHQMTQLLTHQLDFFKEATKTLTNVFDLWNSPASQGIQDSQAEKKSAEESEVYLHKVSSNPVTPQKPLSSQPSSIIFQLSNSQNNSSREVVQQQTVVQALYTFTGRNNKELDLNAGDLVSVSHKLSADWYVGEKMNSEMEMLGKSGMFPANYCRRIRISDRKLQCKTPTNSIERAKSLRRIVSDEPKELNSPIRQSHGNIGKLLESDNGTFEPASNSSSSCIKVKKPLPNIPNKVYSRRNHY
ncbi:BAR adaptor protein [Schizosaccharomyces cryophilus OY26]|uniref:BAR adaptor protein n=1 Tax=Schizosaccharomyces cryophilus (strain OY26 / ATCC MYA-4695 / CBS 11777 / NBRC 106824 / NRRL Y48691) TaxID=653667 RepID=S9VZC5_SCHCR|nr:BAR adaptor protein [Schizosaccharomyces cryophilus OY26]EPY51155.1 BAR adaptor protein [Schizosaccharomyces cryophilus OY26]